MAATASARTAQPILDTTQTTQITWWTIVLTGSYASGGDTLDLSAYPTQSAPDSCLRDPDRISQRERCAVRLHPLLPARNHAREREDPHYFNRRNGIYSRNLFCSFIGGKHRG
jgi:hypothetical protein